MRVTWKVWPGGGLSTIGGLGKLRELPSGIRGGAPAADEFYGLCMQFCNVKWQIIMFYLFKLEQVYSTKEQHININSLFRSCYDLIYLKKYKNDL